MIDTRTTTCPIWCQSGPDDFRQNEPPIGRLGEHLGQTFSLDLGESYSWTVKVQCQQYYDEQGVVPATIRLGIVENEFVNTDAHAFLSREEAGKLVAMLTRALADLDL